MAKQADPVLRQAERGNGGAVGEVTDDRAWRIYYNQYGEPHRLPADPAQLMVLMEQGWTLHKPQHPRKKPVTVTLANGTSYDFGTSAQDLTEAERRRMNTSPAQREAAVAPTATYYTATGSPVPNLPADPENMALYLASGLTLDPPAAKASGKVTLLREA